jgi:2-iminobutanoate/2-iminopropanoate deaminase
MIMTKKVIYTPDAPQPVGPYSQAIAVDGMLYSAGQIALDPVNGTLREVDIAVQTAQVCANLAAVFAAAGLTLADTIKTTCFLTRADDFAGFNEIYAQYFTSAPARSCVMVKDLPKGALVEIEAIACAPAAKENNK